ncbi:MAG: SCO family protein [Bordetella sp.]|nr:MAG: SCO family protein [Bordetella sp.]
MLDFRYYRKFITLQNFYIIFICILLISCSEKISIFQGSDITGTHIGEGLSLKDHNGRYCQLKDFSGKVVIVFFGFTKCPDVCPAALSKLSFALNSLDKNLAQEVQVLFVSIDSKRDNPKLLKEYVTFFHPNFLGLLGTEEEIQETALLFKAYYSKIPAQDQVENYNIDHTSMFYLFDRKNQARVLINSNENTENLIHDINILLKK